MLVILIASGLVIYISYLLFAPVTVIQPLTQPYKVLNQTAKAGDHLVYEVHYCKYLDSPGTINRQIVIDGVAIDSQEQPVFLPTGCPVKKEIKVPLPLNLPNGTYKILINLHYKVNPIRIIDYEFETEEFQIVNPLEKIIDDEQRE